MISEGAAPARTMVVSVRHARVGPVRLFINCRTHCILSGCSFIRFIRSSTGISIFEALEAVDFTHGRTHGTQAWDARDHRRHEACLVFPTSNRAVTRRFCVVLRILGRSRKFAQSRAPPDSAEIRRCGVGQRVCSPFSVTRHPLRPCQSRP